MANYTTNVLSTQVSVLSSTDSFYTTTSAMPVLNFTNNTTLSSVYTANLSANVNFTQTAFTNMVTVMPTASAIDKTVYDTTAFFLSSVNGKTQVDFISGGTIGGVTVTGIAFNPLTFDQLSPSTTTLSAFDGVKFTLNNGFSGQEIAFVLADRSVVPVTVDVLKSQQVLGTTTTFGSYPEIRRLVALGYV